MLPTIVLIGPPGAGKTSVAKVLARRLDVPRIDTDERIAAHHGAIAKIFAESGEAGFRQLEHLAVAQALEQQSAVVSLGGGALTYLPTREAVLSAVSSGARVIELRVAPETAVTRVGQSEDRPLLGELTAEKWLDLVVERLPLYARFATLSVDTVDKTPEQIAAEIVSGLNIQTHSQQQEAN